MSHIPGSANLIPRPLSLCISLAALLLPLSAAHAVVVYNETSGDLSGSQSAPTAISVGVGTNSVVGTVGGGDTQDWLTFNVPSGTFFTSLVLASYTSTDNQGFTGFNSGSTFAGSVNSTGSYLGYAHFGTAATNGSDLPSNVVGINILP